MPDIWIPVTQQNLEIEAGSPLDFSTFLPNPPIDEERRLIVNSDGHIGLQSNPAVPYRLLCGAIATIPDHVTADRMAVQLRRHGYNCARFHFLDIALMEGQLQDFEYRQDILDRFRYYMAALKQNGIYWVVDGLTSNAGALGGVTDRWGTEGRLKLKTHVENAAFGHWLRFQVDIFGTVNPYTGLVPFEDPAMAMVVPFNENGLVFNSWVYANGDLQALAELKRPFNAWLGSNMVPRLSCRLPGAASCWIPSKLKTPRLPCLQTGMPRPNGCAILQVSACRLKPRRRRKWATASMRWASGVS